MIQTITTTASPYRFAGRAAIGSGSIGILSFAVLMAAVTTRTTNALSIHGPVYIMFKAHDVGCILQFLLIVPVVFALYRLSWQQPPGTSKSFFRIGVGAASITALLLILGIFLIVSHGLYTVPQAIFGLWMIIVCGDVQPVISKGLRWFGKVVGLGLIITGMFLPLYAIFGCTIVLQIPAVDPSDPADYPDHFTWMNQHLHYLLEVGTMMGVLTLPFWTILIGRKLLQIKT